MADNYANEDTIPTKTGLDAHGATEPATSHDVTEGGVLGAVGGAIVGGLAGGPIGAVIGAIAGGAASAGAVGVVDKHDNDYNQGVGHTSTMNDDATVNDHLVGTTTTPGTAYGTGTNYAASTDYGTPATSAGANFAQTGTQTVDGQVVVPIVEEELEVGKRQVQSGGAAIHTNVIETPVEQSVNLREEHVTVDRHAVDRPVTAGDTAFQDRSYEVTQTAEVPVVAKTARVVEEVVIGKTATDRVETIHDSVRRTDVDVEELDSTRTGTDRI